MDLGEMLCKDKPLRQRKTDRGSTKQPRIWYQLRVGDVAVCAVCKAVRAVRSVRPARRIAVCAIQRFQQCALWAAAQMDLILGSCHGAKLQSKGACFT
eukprot:IDg23782t1